MSKKRILMTANLDSFFFKFLLPYVSYYKEKGYIVDVATNGDKKIPSADHQYNVCFSRRIFDFHNIKSVWQLKKIVKNSYDMIICHTPMASIATRMVNIPRKKYKIIYTAHGLHFYKGSSRISWLLFYPIEKFLSRFTTKIITINQEDYLLVKDKFHCEACYIEGIGIDTKKFQINLTEREKKDLQTELNVSSKNFVMLFAGELNKNKNQIFLIQAMQKIKKIYPNVVLLLAGEGSYKEEYQKQIKEYNLEENIYLLGFRTDISKILKLCNLVVSSSYREGLPINILEALSSHVPVVATNIRGHRELIKSGENGFLYEIDDTNDFIEKTSYFIKKWENQENCLFDDELIQKYDLDDVLKKMVKLYEK